MYGSPRGIVLFWLSSLFQVRSLTRDCLLARGTSLTCLRAVAQGLYTTFGIARRTRMSNVVPGYAFVNIAARVFLYIFFFNPGNMRVRRFPPLRWLVPAAL